MGLTTVVVLSSTVFIMEATESFNKNYQDNTPDTGAEFRDNSEQLGEHSTIPQPQEIQEKLSGQINQAIDGTSEKLNQLAEKIESTGYDSSTSVGQTAHKVADQVRRGADTLQSTSAEKLGEQMQETIRERPLISIGVALGVGFLISQLLKR
jgi:ElaB/YqjD/DUF883 family membrane-anchored ribosome-binding protein